MATIKYYDLLGSTTASNLIGESGYGTTNSTLISGWTSFNPADTFYTPAIANIVTDGSKWTFTQNVHTISWAIASNGAYQWSDTAQVTRLSLLRAPLLTWLVIVMPVHPAITSLQRHLRQ